tara:strand:+ start:306 stop:779 length:474 start_codon:yes stop_codon:yes gene_type:complete
MANNFIDPDDFDLISQSYSNAFESLNSAKSHLFDAVYRIVTSNETIIEIDLLNEFWNVYQLNSQSLSSLTPFLSSVRALNNHILKRANVVDVNDYLDAFSIVVPDAWAALSEAVGMPIDGQSPMAPPPPPPGPPPPPISMASSGGGTGGGGSGSFMP